MTQATMEQECETYPKRCYRVDVFLEKEKIGYANWHCISYSPVNGTDKTRGYWCGYSFVPEDWHTAAAEDDESISVLYSKFPAIPEITFTSDDERNVIGWDHCHSYDKTHHTNLAGVVKEICTVWSLSQKHRVSQ